MKVVEYTRITIGALRIIRSGFTLLAAFCLVAISSPGAAGADTARAVTIPPDTELEVVHGRSVVIASHRRSGSQIELSIVVVSDDDPLRTRVALVDGQRFTIAVGVEDPDAVATRYVFRRTGRSVDLTLLAGDVPIEATLELSSLLNSTDGTGRRARQTAVVKAALGR